MKLEKKSGLRYMGKKEMAFGLLNFVLSLYIVKNALASVGREFRGFTLPPPPQPTSNNSVSDSLNCIFILRRPITVGELGSGDGENVSLQIS